MTDLLAGPGWLNAGIQAVCFDWGGTLMSEVGPQDRPMCAWPAVERLDGALECLQALHPRVPLCIATNATISHRHHIRLALQRGGIDHFFRHVFCHMDLGMKKDQAAFWDAVARTLGLPLQRIAMVGDSLAFDAIAPWRFGVQGVWLNRGGRPGRWPTEAPPDVPPDVPQVASLAEFAGRILPLLA